jgi:HicB family
MSKASYPLKLPASIKAEAARLAKEDGVSLNQWIATAVAQKIGAVETAAEFFKRRAGGAQPGDLKAFLASVPDVPSEPGDEIPDHLRAKLARLTAKARST